MKSLTTLVLALLPVVLHGQSVISNLAPNKEYYEEIEFYHSTIDYNSDLEIGDKASWLMLSYLNMYETTGDKSYLIKFINVSVNCMLQREDIKLGTFGSFRGQSLFLGSKL